MKPSLEYQQYDDIEKRYINNDIDYFIENSKSSSQVWLTFFTLSFVIFVYGFTLIFNYLFLVKFTDVWQLNNFSDSCLKSSTFVGFSLASLTSGPLCDYFGRKPVLSLALLIALSGCFLSFFLTEPLFFFAANATLGFSFGLTIVSCLCILVEISNTFDRGVFFVLAWSFFPIGTIIACEVAEALNFYNVKTVNWNIFIGIRLFIVAVTFFISIFVKETAKFYFVHGEVAKGSLALESLINFNNGVVPERVKELLEKHYSRQRELLNQPSLIKLFTGNALKLTIITLLLQFVGFLAFFASYYSYPLIADDLSVNALLDTEVKEILVKRLANLSISEGFFEFFANIVFAIIPSTDRFKRIGTIRLSFFLAFISAFLSVIVPEIFALYFGFTKTFLSMAGICIYLYVAEVFPTAMRANAIGFNTFISRLGAILGPFLAANLIEVSKFVVPWMVAVVSLICFLLADQLTVETFKRNAN